MMKRLRARMAPSKTTMQCEVLQLQCYCTNNKKNGCDWQGDEVENDSRNSKEMNCTQCHEFMCRTDMEQHETVFAHCPYCGDQYDAQSLLEHEASCHMKSMECPYKCGNFIMVDQLHCNVESCSKILADDVCPYQIVGCMYKPLDSVDLSNHMKEARRRHTEFTVSQVTTLQQSNAETRQHLLIEQNKCAQLEKQHEEKNEDLTVLETEIQKMKDKVHALQQERESIIQDKFESSEIKVKEDIKEIELRIQQDGLSSIEKSLTQLEIDGGFNAKISSLLAFLECSSSGGTNLEEFHQFIKEQIRILDQLESGSAVLCTNISDLQLQLQLSESTSYNGSVVDNVMNRQNQVVTALHRSPYVQGVVDTSSTQEPTVSDLDYKHIKKLGCFLDSDDITGRNWERVGQEIFLHDGDACDEIDVIHLAYSGGGSQAKEFLVGLVTCYPTFTVAAFNVIAIKHRRRDISLYIQSLNCPEEQYFRDLNSSQRNKIARFLDKEVCVGEDWQMFAYEVGFTIEEIKIFRLALKKRKMYSPTECLLDFIKQKKPTLKLTEVQEVLLHVGRNDVVRYLDTVIDEIANTEGLRSE